MAVKRRAYVASMQNPPAPVWSPGFPPGAKVYVDGNALATVVQWWPEGNTSQLGAHYSVRFHGGPAHEIVRVHPSRVGVRRIRS